MAFPRLDVMALLRLAAGIAIGTAGGYLATLAGIPAGWLSGALLATAIATSCGLNVAVPAPVVQVMFILLGLTIGASVTPETLSSMRQWPIAFLTLTISMVLVTVVVIAYLRRFENYDRQTAFFSAIPGALSMVLAMTMQSRADLRTVVVIQTVRLVVLIAFLPAIIKLFGFAAPPSPSAAPVIAEAPLVEYAVWIGVSTVAALAVMATKFPGGTILGAMFASAILHGTGYTTAHMPSSVTTGAFVMMGVLIASRMHGLTMGELRRMMRPSLLALAIGTALAMAAALVAAPIAGIETGKMVLSFAPGAFEAMIILAFVLDLDPAFVGSMHLARFVVISLALPLVVRLYFGRQTGRDQDAP